MRTRFCKLLADAVVDERKAGPMYRAAYSRCRREGLSDSRCRVFKGIARQEDTHKARLGKLYGRVCK